MKWIRAHIAQIVTYSLAVLMTAIGVMHFVDPTPFVAIMPRLIPYKLAMVYISGAFEIAFGIGLLAEKSRAPAAVGLIVLYVVVFPANINMAINNIAVGGKTLHPALLWGRLPFQAAFVYWAYWIYRDGKSSATRHKD